MQLVHKFTWRKVDIYISLSLITPGNYFSTKTLECARKACKNMSFQEKTTKRSGNPNWKNETMHHRKIYLDEPGTCALTCIQKIGNVLQCVFVLDNYTVSFFFKFKLALNAFQLMATGRSSLLYQLTNGIRHHG